jgi:hypothetical protein
MKFDRDACIHLEQAASALIRAREAALQAATVLSDPASALAHDAAADAEIVCALKLVDLARRSK